RSREVASAVAARKVLLFQLECVDEMNDAELLVFVKAGADARPVPGSRFAAVVVDAVEVGSPAAARLRRHVLQRLQQVVGKENFRAPAGDTRPRLLAPAPYMHRLAGLPPRFPVVPGSPAVKLTVEVGD